MQCGFSQFRQLRWMASFSEDSVWAGPSGGPVSRSGKTPPAASQNTHWAEKHTPSGPRPSIRYSFSCRMPTIRSSWPRVASLL